MISFYCLYLYIAEKYSRLSKLHIEPFNTSVCATHEHILLAISSTVINCYFNSIILLRDVHCLHIHLLQSATVQYILLYAFIHTQFFTSYPFTVFFSTTFKFASIPAHHCPLISRTHRAKGRARVKLLCSVSRSVFATISMYVRTVRTHLLYVSHSQRIIRLLYCLNISLGTHRCDK